MTLALEIPVPTSSFIQWALRITDDLADYHIAPPTDEANWSTWAEQLVGIDDFDNLVPRPDAFPDWRAWANRLLQNIG